MHVHSPILEGQLIEQVKPLTLKVRVLGRFSKNVKKKVGKFLFFGN